MARPKKKRDSDEEKVNPFELEEDYIPRYGKSTTKLLGGEYPMVEDYTLPEWSKQISEDFIRQANVKGSPGFDPGFAQAQQVEQMIALGASTTDVAAILRIEPKLLEKYYAYEIETASGRINQRVAKIAGANGGAIEFREIKQRVLDAIDAEITDVTYDEDK